MMFIRLVFSLVLIVFVLKDTPAFSTPLLHVKASLLSERNGLVVGGTHWIMLRLEVQKGWHIYWTNPGDAGLPPTLSWTLPTGITAGNPKFPLPQRITLGNAVSFGFYDTVRLLIPLTVTSLPPFSVVALKTHVKWLVCEDICIPENTNLSLTLPIVNAPNSAPLTNISEFSAARNLLPQPLTTPTPTFHINTHNHTITLSFNPSLTNTNPSTSFSFFPFESNIIVNHAEQKISLTDPQISLTIPLNPHRPPQTISSFDGVLTSETSTLFGVQREGFLLSPQRLETSEADSINLNSTKTSVLSPSQTNVYQISLPFVLLLGLLGGLFLNLMPCVFPVLFLKAFDLIKSGVSGSRYTRIQGLVFSAGIMTTFSTLGTILMLLQFTGSQIGWGFQLQHPSIVFLLGILFFTLGLSFSGVWTIGASFMGLGSKQAAQKGYRGTFLTGVLAVVVAAPCTVPFMSTAIGFAITQPYSVGLAIFLTLGIGMSVPYLLLSWNTAWAKLLPKPGIWMEYLKQGLAFPMYGTSAWLLWILVRQIGEQGMVIGLLGGLSIAFTLWLYGTTRTARSTTLRKIGIGGGISGVLGIVLLSLWVGQPKHPSLNTPQTIPYEPYSPERLNTLIMQGETVFVNFTASWCLTCLVNEKLVLNSEEIVRTFIEKDVVSLKADWTLYNPQITKALNDLGRNGVPVYVLYRPDEPYLVLPELLTKNVLLQVLR